MGYHRYSSKYFYGYLSELIIRLKMEKNEMSKKKVKNFFKRIAVSLFPSYRKLSHIQDTLDKRIRVLSDSTIKSLDATTNQCWSLRHQMLHMSQQLNDLEQLSAVVNGIKKQVECINKNVIQSQNMLWYSIPLNGQTKESAMKAFWAQYPKAKGNLKLVQSANLFLMKKLKDICDENGLKFWLHGGTLIGAIRHEGFIPWDDDVDVGMTREDLKSLICLLETNDDYTVQTLYHNHNVEISKGYQFKQKNGPLPNFIDIFVFDKCLVSESRKDLAIKLEEIRSVRRSLVNDYINLPHPFETIDIGYYCYGPIKEEDEEFVENFFKEHLELLGDVNEGNAYYYSIENYPFPYPVLLEDKMMPLELMKFEDAAFYVPKNPEYYLDGYGDIWQMPKDIDETPHLYAFEPYLEEIKDFFKQQ